MKFFETSKEEAENFCLCYDCPTYVEGATPVAYCHPEVGSSDEIEKESACLCERCPVYNDQDLENDFYCTRGSEEEQAA